MQQSHLMPLQCGLSVDYWPLALRQLFNLTCRYSRYSHPKIFAIWIANFSWFRKPNDFPALFGWWRNGKLKKFAMKIAKSTYITLRISLPLLQTLPSFWKLQKLKNQQRVPSLKRKESLLKAKDCWCTFLFFCRSAQLTYCPSLSLFMYMFK